MKAPLFDEILNISQAIADASGNNDDEAREKHYQALIKLCAANENTPRDHPLQWEALADFTIDTEQALDIYQKGLDCAQLHKLDNSTASLHLAIALRYQEMEDKEKALASINLAKALLDSITIDELKQEINELFNELSA